MGGYKGFDKTVIHLTRYDGEASKVECLICRTCQAIILQHGTNEYAKLHQAWHMSLDAQIAAAMYA